MKIIRDKVAGLQFEDINFLISREEQINKPFFNEVSDIFKRIDMKLDNIDASNKYTFIEFTNSASIDYIESVDCIVDFDEINSLSLTDLVRRYDNLDTSKNILFDKLSSSSSESKRKIYLQRVNDLLYKKYQLDTFIEYKKGYKNIEFPDIVKAPRRKHKKNLLYRLKNVFTPKTN